MRNRYFPQHLRAGRPYYNRTLLAEVMAEVTRNGNPAKPLFNRIIEQAERAGLPAKHLLQNNFLATEVLLVQTFLQLEHDGTPLYDIEPTLLEALAQSDPGDMRLEDLHTPNRIYYLHWGPQEDLKLFGKHSVEGALVATSDTDWRIALVARTDYGWMLPPERDSFVLRFPGAALAMPFSSAVQYAVEADKQDILSAFESMAREDGGVLSADKQARRIQMLKEHDGNAPVLTRALELAGNCMAYLTAYPADSRFGWQPDTPSTQLLKLTRGGKEEVRTRSKLLTTGYLQVHRVGQDFQAAYEAMNHGGASAGFSGSVRPHWRRGHWRHQAHGPEMALRKLIWMQPTRVLGGPGTPQA